MARLIKIHVFPGGVFQGGCRIHGNSSGNDSRHGVLLYAFLPVMSDKRPGSNSYNFFEIP